MVFGLRGRWCCCVLMLPFLRVKIWYLYVADSYLSFSLFELGIQGHIEDIAISKQHQGKHLGLSLLTALSHIAKEVGCYKVCLKQCLLCFSGFFRGCLPNV